MDLNENFFINSHRYHSSDYDFTERYLHKLRGCCGPAPKLSPIETNEIGLIKKDPFKTKMDKARERGLAKNNKSKEKI